MGGGFQRNNTAPIVDAKVSDAYWVYWRNAAHQHPI